MEIIDVSDWEVNYDLQISGTKEKEWLTSPGRTQANTAFMFKEQRENTGEAWTEFVAAELGRLLGYEMMEVHFAVKDGKQGVLLKRFTSRNKEFFEGGDLISRIKPEFVRNQLAGYDFDAIEEALKYFNLVEDFVKIPVFDAFIANSDRHCDNWGIIRSENKLAPFYDNGSSLGFNATIDQTRMRLSNPHAFEAFTNRGFTLIGLPSKKKPKHLKLLDYINDKYASNIRLEINRVSTITKQDIENVVQPIPESFMESIYKEWVVKLLLYRKEWLGSWLKSTMAN